MRYFETNDGKTIIIENDIQYGFSQVNFCPMSKIEIYPLTMKRFNLVIYLEETSNSTSDSWVQFSAMIVGWDGIVYKRLVLNTTLDFNSPPNISINGTGTFSLPNTLSLNTTTPAAFVAFLIKDNNEFNYPFPIYQTTTTLSLLEINDCGIESFEGSVDELQPNITRFLLRIFTNIGIIGQIFDSKDNFNSEWDIPINFTIANLTTNAISNTTENSNSGGFGIFINNTVFLVQSNENNENGSVWSIISTDLPKVFDEFVSLGINNLELRITVLESTFNQPSSKYYITFDDNFVRSKLTNNAIVGVSPRFWILNTPESNDTFTDTTITGFIRLSESRTSLFTNLSKSDQTLFVDQLISQISMILPISLTRIFGSTKFRFETKVTTKQLLLPITISSTSTIENVTSERSVINVAKNLDTLIRNKRITALSFLDKLEDVDEGFGYRWEVKEKINYKLATVGIALSILAISIILFFMTRKDSEELWESYFSSPISTILKLGGIEILDVGCGSAVWLMEMSTIYPHSKFTGIDKIKHHSMPSNIKFVQSDITDINNRFPFNEKIFDFIHISSFFITLPEKSCNITIFPELFRILKPGGWLEVCEYDGNLLPNFGPITKYFVDLLFSSLSNQGISIVSTGELLINLFEENNFKFYCDYKIVKRDEIDLAKAAFKNTFISFKHILIEFTPFSSQEYFDLLDEVDKEFFEYDSSLQMVRIYGQKPMKFMEVF
ncbi:6646_t:CDS:10 [Diversispora eburnea]|uniref:6646_t:CDS:1 n=1 Tax=Diversispora eburnea TaxID=1213867 RepID=A0A9N8YWR8_9GLOM|nr:6646_t:CDS:10 [Diversispora eburnea]